MRLHAHLEIFHMDIVGVTSCLFVQLAFVTYSFTGSGER